MLEWKCFYASKSDNSTRYEPIILNVADVPNDQGG